MSRELAIPGEVLVHPGDRVAGDAVVARSTRLFLRPFFLPVAASLQVDPSEVEACLRKRPGDAIEAGELLAQRRHRLKTHEFRAQVTGRIEKILPDGNLLVREAPAMAREVATVRAADELGVAPKRLAPYLRCAVGQEIEKGSPVASILTPGKIRAALSPVRGRVAEIDAESGIVRVEPLREDLEVRAWIPGIVEATSDRGAVLAADGFEITGVWGVGGECAGILSRDFAPGAIVQLDHLSRGELAQGRDAKVAGVVAAGADLAPLLDEVWPFTVVILGGFGEHEWEPVIREILEAVEGMRLYADGTTELRVGVRRPRFYLVSE